MLLTVLGEYVLPDGLVVWQEALIRGLGSLGYSTQAARQALARSATDGWIANERQGRRSRVHLTDSGREMLSSGAERIYGFGEPWEWDGRWLLVAVRVPESRRDVRHRLRTSLAWEGFGSLGGGLWISPHVEREEDLARLAEETPGAALFSFVAETGQLGDPAEVVSSAWDLDGVERQYREFARRFSGRDPSRPEAVFRALTELVHEWRRFPFLDPNLPESLLPARWPRARAHDLFSSARGRWHEEATAYFRSLGEAD
jgi:phenylacetic acid degradation operon negative regulatory protein